MEDEKKIIYPERPVLERGRYMEDAEAQIAASQRLAELQEKRAKRERDMAIFSDIANLVTKGAAVAGGAWKIDKEEAKSAKENERLRALRDSNSKQLAEYAKLRMAAQDAQRKDDNAAALAMHNADVDAYKHALEQEKYAKDQERKDKIADSEIKKNEAYANYYNNGGKGTTSKSSASGGKSIDLVNDDGTRTKLADAHAAYAEIIKRDPRYKIQKEVKLYTKDALGNVVPDLNEDGTQKTKMVDALPKDITLQQVQQVVAKYNARQLVGSTIEPAKSAKKANPMSGGKKSNPMN